jgi:hypothetical protein
MISKDKQYRTRDGREVRIYATDGTYPNVVHGAFLGAHGWENCCWLNSGLSKEGHHRSYDLIEVKPRIKRTVWLNVYSAHSMVEIYKTKERADECAGSNRIACIRVDLDFEEGEGL